MAFLRGILLLSIAGYIATSNALPGFSAFKLTYGIKLNPFSSEKFYVDLPQTYAEAIQQNWHSISNEDCTNGGKYNGHRFVFGNDNSVAILYDTKGAVAGIQMNINATSVAGTGFRYGDVSMYTVDSINGNPVYTLTAYFIDPATVCTTGRTIADLNAQGTANALYFQNGPNPNTQYITVPQQRASAITQGWTKNSCFPGMGYHNFYESLKYQDSQCLAFRPAFLLYDEECNGNLRGFGLAALGKAYSENARYEYPPKAAIKMIVGADNVAQCLLDKADGVGLTTMHVFFADSSQTNPLCPLSSKECPQQ